MILYVKATWWGNIVVSIMELLNAGVYSLIKIFCQLVMNIANTQLFDQGIIQSFLDRVYVVLGIYMLFKVAISLLTSIVNPDKLTDKESGMQKIIPRTIIALAMLVFVPSIIEQALIWQNDIALAVPRLIIGYSSDSGNVTTSDQGEILAATALKAFIVPNEACSKENLKDADDILKSANSVSTVLGTAYERCATSGEEKNQFKFEFSGFVSMIVGIFLVFCLASYCIDMATRTIKLGILRVLAPIPIISYIDPKSEKNGSFGNWAKECVTTYIELFIKLGIFYFVLFILQGIASETGSGIVFPSGISSTMKQFIRLFIIIGAFFFMGKGANFICNILGVKYNEKEGGFMKNLAAIGAIGALGLSTLSSTVSGGRRAMHAANANAKANGMTVSKGRQIMNAIGGGLLGGAVGAVHAGGMASQKKGFMNIVGATNARNAQLMRYADEGGTTIGGLKSFFGEAFTGDSPMNKLEADWKSQEASIKKMEEANSFRKTIMDRVSSEAATSLDTIGVGKTTGIIGNAFKFSSALAAARSGVGVYEKTNTWYQDNSGNHISETSYNMLSDAAKSAYTRQQSTNSYFQFDNQEINLAQGDIIAKELLDANKTDYYDKSLSGIINDATINSAKNSFFNSTGQTIENDLKDLKTQFGITGTKINDSRTKLRQSQNSEETRRAQANAQRFKNGGK